jgi:hypothetical protein
MKIKKLSAVLTALMLLSSVTACSGEDVSETTAEENKIINVADVSLSDDSIISINRSVRSETVSMGEAGTWTVFVYLCGADLESENYGNTAYIPFFKMGYRKTPGKNAESIDLCSIFVTKTH